MRLGVHVRETEFVQKGVQTPLHGAQVEQRFIPRQPEGREFNEADGFQGKEKNEQQGGRDAAESIGEGAHGGKLHPGGGGLKGEGGGEKGNRREPDQPHDHPGRPPGVNEQGAQGNHEGKVEGGQVKTPEEEDARSHQRGFGAQGGGEYPDAQVGRRDITEVFRAFAHLRDGLLPFSIIGDRRDED